MLKLFLALVLAGFGSQAHAQGWNIGNVAGTISLPTGASTSAKQPALGTAGVAATDILTVQGIASMTPLLATVTGSVNAIQSGTWNTNATLAAETTKVIGTVNQGTSPWVVSGTVSANAGTNLNTSLLALESGGNLASLVTQLGAVTASPTANTVLDRLKTLNTTLGSPFQAGASIGNASFGISGTLPAYAAIPSFKIDQTTPGTTNLVALAANQSANVAQINGVTPLMGNGITGTGSQRVTIASDNTAFAVNSTLSAETTKVIGTVNQGTSPWVISGALTANQSVNVAQMNGVTTTMGNGIAGTGVQRVAIASDNTAFSVNSTLSAETTKVIGTVNQGTSPWVISGALTANQSVNTAQFGGTNISTGAGAGGAGIPRVTISNDSSLAANQSVNHAQVNGVTVSTNTGVAGTGTQRVTLSNTDPCASPDIAKSSAKISVTSATTTSLVAVSGSTTVYVCGYSFTIAPSATAADTAVLEYGTGASCTSPTALTGTYGNGDLTSAAPVTHITYGGAFTAIKSASSAGICILTAGTAVNVQGVLTYVQQ